MTFLEQSARHRAIVARIRHKMATPRNATRAYLQNGNGNGYHARLEDAVAANEAGLMEVKIGLGTTQVSLGEVQRGLTSLTTNVERLATAFESSRRTNWPMIFTGIGILFTVVPGLYFLIISTIGNVISPMAERVSSMNSTLALHGTLIEKVSDQAQKSASADANSQTDRHQLNERVVKLEDLYTKGTADRREAIATIQARLSEIEGQFHSVSNTENLRWANQQRLNSLMWNKSFPDSKFPDTTFYPPTLFQGFSK